MRKVILGLAIAAVAWGPARLASADNADDRAAAQKIAENMKQSGQLKDYRVGVKFQNGVAWLMGSVTSAEQKAAAERIARETEGVERVVSKLEIAGEANEPSQVSQPLASPQVQPAMAAMPQAAQPRTLRQSARRSGNMPVPFARTMQGDVQQANYGEYCPTDGMGGPMAMGHVPGAVGASVAYDNPQMPGYAWPSYAAYPNYAALTYPQQYSPSAWPYIGPFYPYPQVPLGWRKVTLEWDDGWWFLDFKDQSDCCH
ncbi:MAG: hypothetical protein DCC67_04065 [Planctomycetota bacterium]|nr:MAG: hypothetical protein DCC67_04065 [Planctomycetota bacterium]